MFKPNIIKLLILLSALHIACKGESKANQDMDFETAVAELEERKAKAAEWEAKLCSEFPKQLVMEHHPHSKRIDIEPTQLSCKIKLFYGDKDHEFWEGQVAVYPNQQEDPFWQYHAKEGRLNHPVKEFGDRAVYVGLTYQLLILKDGLIYDIAPPNNGSITSTGKATKEIVFEIARHYKL
ncbi:MAG: hypothetical protein HRT65_01645 [Flavobacteriaceae bacterium]|nr:hypothetical protein [Flavobacteriaceae bacterium]